MEMTENRINEFEDRIYPTWTTEEIDWKKNEQSLRNLWGNSKRSNIHITESHESWKLLRFVENINAHIQETKQIKNRIKPKKSMPMHIIIKFLQTKCKEKIWNKKVKTEYIKIWTILYQHSHHCGLLYLMYGKFCLKMMFTNNFILHLIFTFCLPF